MSYSGTTYTIPCERGGLSADPNIDAIKPEMMVMVRNVNIHQNGREKRGGTAHVNGSAGYGSVQLMGGFDFIKLSGAQTLVIGTTDGKLWSNTTTTIKTGLATGKYFNFEVFANELYICNGSDVPQTWDGTAAGTSAITNPAADWTGTNNPFQLIKHGRGNSERLWAILPAGVYASGDGTPKTFTTGVINIPISVNDGTGLVGAIEFGNRLICFSKRKSYIIDDSSLTTTDWGYETSIWEGGAAHWRLIVKTPNDIVCMMDDGNIYSLTSVQSYGDYKTASITKPSWIDKWIRDNCDLGQIDKFHAKYDNELRRIYFFIVRTGQTTIDTALIYNIDRGAEEGWTLHDNQNYASGYSASVSWVNHKIPAAHHSYYIYTGDYSGFVWELEESNRNDNNNAYYAGFKTSHLIFEDARVTKKYKRGWLTLTAQGNYNLYVNWWADGIAQTAQTVSQAGTGAAIGSFILDTDILGGAELINVPFDLGNKGRRIQFEIYNGNVNENFYVSKLLTDFKPLSARAV